MIGRADRWIRRTTIGCVGMLALIAGTVSYLHMHLLVEMHGQPGWVAALTPLSVDGMIVAASTTLLAELASADARRLPAVGAAGCRERGEPGGERRGCRADGDGPGDRCVAVIRADRLVRAADASGSPRRGDGCAGAASGSPGRRRARRRQVTVGRPRRASLRYIGAGRLGGTCGWMHGGGLRITAAEDGSLPSGRDIGTRYGRHERWGRQVKRSGLAGELDT